MNKAFMHDTPGMSPHDAPRIAYLPLHHSEALLAVLEKLSEQMETIYTHQPPEPEPIAVTDTVEQGWVMAFAAGGIAKASQDTRLKFPAHVKKVIIYNASANAIPLEFDDASNANSFPLLPGDRWILDGIKTKRVHIFPSVDTNINVAGGLFIRGWEFGN